MVEKNQDSGQVVVEPQKSVSFSLIITILFGPLGLFYSTVSGAVIMLVLSVVLGLMTAGMGLVLTWPVSVIWGVMAVSSANEKVLTRVAQQA